MTQEARAEEASKMSPKGEYECSAKECFGQGGWTIRSVDYPNHACSGCLEQFMESSSEKKKMTQKAGRGSADEEYALRIWSARKLKEAQEEYDALHPEEEGCGDSGVSPSEAPSSVGEDEIEEFEELVQKMKRAEEIKGMAAVLLGRGAAIPHHLEDRMVKYMDLKSKASMAASSIGAQISLGEHRKWCERGSKRKEEIGVECAYIYALHRPTRCRRCRNCGSASTLLRPTGDLYI